MEEMNTNPSNINLVNFFEFMGETILKHSTTTYKLADYDSVVISNQSPSTYYRFSEGRGGNVFTACKDIYNLSKEESFEKIKDFLEKINNKHFIPSTDFSKNTGIEVKKEFKVTETDKNKEILNTYLVGKRGISQNLVNILYKKKYVSVDEKNNVLFKIKDNDNKVVGYDIVGTTKNFYKRKTVPNLGFNIKRKKDDCKNLFVFESSIDLLSFIDLMDSDNRIREEFKAVVKDNSNAQFIAMSGLKESTMVNYLKGIDTICICTDNDVAGEKFYNKIKNNYKGLEVIRIKPNLKDFNDDLLVKKKEKSRWCNKVNKEDKER